MTATSGAAQLADQLGDDVPPGLIAHLTDEDLAHLAELLAAAKERQVSELARGGEAALAVVPRLLRLPFRRAMGL